MGSTSGTGRVRVERGIYESSKRQARALLSTRRQAPRSEQRSIIGLPSLAGPSQHLR
jgi:hypothetical protein